MFSDIPLVAWGIIIGVFACVTSYQIGKINGTPDDFDDSDDTVKCQKCKCLIIKKDAFTVERMEFGFTLPKYDHYCQNDKPNYDEIDLHGRRFSSQRRRVYEKKGKA